MFNIIYIDTIYYESTQQSEKHYLTLFNESTTCTVTYKIHNVCLEIQRQNKSAIQRFILKGTGNIFILICIFKILNLKDKQMMF